MWFLICKMYPCEHLPESLKNYPYLSNEIRKRSIIEYDTTSYITSVALSYSIKNSAFINSKSLDLFHRTRGFMLLQMMRNGRTALPFAAQPHNCQMTVSRVTRVTTLMTSQSVSLQVTMSCLATCCQVTS